MYSLNIDTSLNNDTYSNVWCVVPLRKELSLLEELVTSLLQHKWVLGKTLQVKHKQIHLWDLADEGANYIYNIKNLITSQVIECTSFYSN